MDDKNIQNIDTLLRATIKENASDMFVTKGFPPAVKRDGKIIPITHD